MAPGQDELYRWLQAGLFWANGELCDHLVDWVNWTDTDSAEGWKKPNVRKNLQAHLEELKALPQPEIHEQCELHGPIRAPELDKKV